MLIAPSVSPLELERLSRGKIPAAQAAVIPPDLRATLGAAWRGLGDRVSVPAPAPRAARRGGSLVGLGLLAPLLSGVDGELTQERVSAALTLAEAHFGRERVHGFVRDFLERQS